LASPVLAIETVHRCRLVAKSKDRSYAQLYRQPTYYRGQIVTVHGAVHSFSVKGSRITSASAATSSLIQPSNRPHAAGGLFASSAPGFPELKDRDRDGGMMKFNEVTVHGILFKRGRYAGQHGRTRAVVQAQTATWHSATIGLGRSATSPRVLWQGAILAVALAAVIIGVVYWTSFRRTRRPEPRDERAISASLKSLERKEEIQSPHEALAQLERQSRAESRDASES
jgi:hypothetical protein